MQITISRTGKYIPKWQGNRQLPEKAQVSVEYAYMTPEQEERYTTFKPRYHSEDDGNPREVEITIETHALEIWRECVQRVHNLRVGPDEITSPKEVAEIPGIYDLITEVVAHIKKGLEITEHDAKN